MSAGGDTSLWIWNASQLAQAVHIDQLNMALFDLNQAGLRKPRKHSANSLNLNTKVATNLYATHA